jgi:hypothetical protein
MSQPVMPLLVPDLGAPGPEGDPEIMTEDQVGDPVVSRLEEAMCRQHLLKWSTKP